jgi:hypothetical protein
MIRKFPFPFVIPNSIVRTCDYYFPIDESGRDLSKYPICKKCKTRNFQARWYNNGSNKGGDKHFFCKNCSILVDLTGKDTMSDRRLICYDEYGNSIPYTDHTS